MRTSFIEVPYDDWNIEEVDEMLEEDYVVHVDDSHRAPPSDSEVVDDPELDMRPHHQHQPCKKHGPCGQCASMAGDQRRSAVV